MRRTEMVRALSIATITAVAACGGGGVSDTGTGPGPTPPVDTTRPPTVQRASITARVTIDPADATIASVAGVTAGGVTVRLTRAASGFHAADRGHRGRRRGAIRESAGGAVLGERRPHVDGGRVGALVAG